MTNEVSILTGRIADICDKVRDEDKQTSLRLTMAIYMLEFHRAKKKENQIYILGILAGMLQGIAWQDDGTLQDDIEKAVLALNAIKKELAEEIKKVMEE